MSRVNIANIEQNNIKQIIEDLIISFKFTLKKLNIVFKINPASTYNYIFTLPNNYVCIQRKYQIVSDDPFNIKYGFIFDNLESMRWNIEPSIITPNVTFTTEQGTFSGNYIKTTYVFFQIQNLHDTDVLQVKLDVDVILVDESYYKEILFPLMSAKYQSVNARITEIRQRKQYEEFLPTYKYGTLPNPDYSETINFNYRCKTCGAKVEARFNAFNDLYSLKFRDEHLFNNKSQWAFWGGKPHIDCPFFRLLNKADYDNAVSNGEIEQI